MRHDQVGIAHRQHVGAHADGGARKESIARGFDRERQLHASDLSVLGGRQHARFHVGAVCVMGGLRQDHPLPIKNRLLGVDQSVVRGVFLARDALTGVEHRIKRLSVVVQVTLTLAQGVHLQPVVEQVIDDSAQAHSTSKIPAAPMPPPMHMVTATRLAPRRLPSIKAWPVKRWPLTP